MTVQDIVYIPPPITIDHILPIKTPFETISTAYARKLQQEIHANFFSHTPTPGGTLLSPIINDKKFAGINHRPLTTDELITLETCYAFDQHDDHKIIIIPPDHPDRETRDISTTLILDKLCTFYFNEITDRLATISPYFTHTDQKLLNSPTSLTHILHEQLSNTPKNHVRNIYKHTIFAAREKQISTNEPSNHPVDTTHYLEHITLAPLTLDLITRALTTLPSDKNHTHHVNEIYNHIEHNTFFDTPSHPRAYRRRIHTNNFHPCFDEEEKFVMPFGVEDDRGT